MIVSGEKAAGGWLPAIELEARDVWDAYCLFSDNILPRQEWVIYQLLADTRQTILETENSLQDSVTLPFGYWLGAVRAVYICGSAMCTGSVAIAAGKVSRM